MAKKKTSELIDYVFKTEYKYDAKTAQGDTLKVSKGNVVIAIFTAMEDGSILKKIIK